MKKLFSVLTDDLEHCFVCDSSPVAIHHIFYGTSNRKKSETYGFLVPLHPYFHTNSDNAIHRGNKQLDLHLKQLAQSYYEENIGTREEFIKEFGRNYL
ncbi:phosphoenolpyruvate carboxykinase [Anaerosacchariphilus polymeriproducens]|uniref:Phosphoenolpyruvate carboxykinase n=1 Tax=Anaerosacchariphilus polymeriproducens TaxID=1812858 RepID=A0A371ATG2_9FIRM|nr:phosphoenolpyruvate carboxykinase [Anaerosacchariphilus polymeriproducens]RDU22857.1 phosphoenolpyruvate carboxykinase [Anaerosacchariphilus polymeriproducens]